ncbi:DUF4150 domain-containing protein [Myxococcus xanthus]|uniref:DUF4150 domain-containing protein n=2 Tax=Myxococcus xanthus TaxID=34 RepID=UPI000348C401|nr:DUF4150 domain-containing protein [Myxococcus xanthus]QVW70465.1 DUF4150 domain-containing protein [Myxococcus xanthus DZ2]QZZ49336.1 hypothetical protein MyxoNM_09005 [Myxococcus xanthus]UEO03407.1 DUF4150 domain-containing protein [Myxococcus xanthus DZ2]UYI16421.1 DUF4150 domain-containing protein [Myxococcus xanthus]UYI23783.1 DUF4150 domain-containing protein [Myxococcus xanthus]
MSNVYANGRSIIHKGSGNTHTSAAPDVCKVPTPGGPVPTPFVNSAQDSMLTKGSKSVTINGHPVALTDSELSVSSGDEPGTAGGLISSKFKGKMAWGSGSVDVKIEGKGVVRFLDVTLHNGNSFNAAFMSNGHNGTGFAYADDFKGACIICQKDPDSHAVIERQETEEEQSLAIAKKILKDLKAREAEWAQVNQEIITKEAQLKRLLEGTNSPPKQATLDERRAQIQEFEEKRKGLEDHRRANSTGYMFGVMVCRDGERFAAVSGGEVPPGFMAIADTHGCTVIGEAATLEDFLAINPRCAAGDTSAIRKLSKRWDYTETLVAEKVNREYKNKPGTCAGAKLIGKSGHVANSMTEIFFAFPSARKKAYKIFYRGPSEYSPPKDRAVGPDGKGSGAWKPPSVAAVIAAIKEGRGGEPDGERVDMRRKSEETVPSCRSCQDTLFMARCDLEVQTCG